MVINQPCSKPTGNPQQQQQQQQTNMLKSGTYLLGLQLTWTHKAGEGILSDKIGKTEKEQSIRFSKKQSKRES